VALGLAGFLWKTHLVPLEHRQVSKNLADRMVVRSLFHPANEHVLNFAARTTLALFHYLWWSGFVGALALALFVGGIALMVRERAGHSIPPLILLVCLPFLVNLGVALAGKYPYGGTRHCVWLAVFAVPAISLSLSRLYAKRAWPVIVGLGLALLIVNIFPAPRGAYIKPADQSVNVMRQSTQFLAERALRGAAILSDNQSAFLLSYYLCHAKVAQFAPDREPLKRSPCAGGFVLAAPRFIFDGPGVEAAIARTSAGDRTNLWLFQSGWDVGKPDVLSVLRENGCAVPRRFGANILICKLSVPNQGTATKD
jgi:hypothetical protein